MIKAEIFGVGVFWSYQNILGLLASSFNSSLLISQRRTIISLMDTLALTIYSWCVKKEEGSRRMQKCACNARSLLPDVFTLPTCQMLKVCWCTLSLGCCLWYLDVLIYIWYVIAGWTRVNHRLVLKFMLNFSVWVLNLIPYVVQSSVFVKSKRTLKFESLYTYFCLVSSSGVIWCRNLSTTPIQCLLQ